MPWINGDEKINALCFRLSTSGQEAVSSQAQSIANNSLKSVSSCSPSNFRHAAAPYPAKPEGKLTSCAFKQPGCLLHLQAR